MNEKDILFLDGAYVGSVAHLKSLFSNPDRVKKSTFRNEVLAAYKDGVLAAWFWKLGEASPLPANPRAQQDDPLFRELYAALTGETLNQSFKSNFNKLGEFLRCEIGGQSYTSQNGVVTIDIGDWSDGPVEVKFVFKAIGVENNIFHFAVRAADGQALGQTSLDWHQMQKGQEYSVKCPLNLKAYEDKELLWVEGQDNVLCKLQPKGGTISVGNVTFKMIRVEGGTFQMDSNYKVTLSTYNIGETQVTQALWREVMGGNHSSHKGDNLPVENVSWDDCQEFLKKLNKKTGKHFRLPTEAEWEFAARGGNRSKGYTYSGGNNLDKVGWYSGNSSSQTHPVKQKAPNELGIYDMSGNVWEWCQDYYGSYPSGSKTNPQGPSSGSYRVFRGGSWDYDASSCSPSYRDGYGFYDGHDFLGLRLALSE